jgi:hypothetical protein
VVLEVVVFLDALARFDLAFDDLGEGDIGIPHAWATLDEWWAACGELFDSFGDEVDQDRRVRDDQCGLVNEFGFHEVVEGNRGEGPTFVGT